MTIHQIMSGKFDTWCGNPHPHPQHKTVPYEFNGPPWCLGLPDDPILRLRANQADDAQRAADAAHAVVNDLVVRLYKERRRVAQ